jgi:hypothetical protein
VSLAEDIKARLIIEQVNLLRFDERESRTLRKRFVELESELTSLIAKYDIPGSSQTTVRQRRLEKMLRDARTILRKVYRDLRRRQIQRNALFALENARTVAQQLNILLGENVIGTIPNQNTILKLGRDLLIEGAKSSTWWQTLERDIQDRFVRAMRRGVMANETLPELINRVRGTRENNYSDGIIKISTNQARNLIRSSLTGVVNEGRLQMYRENADVISRIQWSAVLDSRTTEICIALNGLTWTNPDYEPVGHNQVFPGPVAHWGERSTQVPIVAAFDELTPAVKRKLNRGLRPTQFGEIPTDAIGLEWLRQQDKATQIAILGVEKQKLFAAGEINSIRDLVDQSNRPLTLRALRARLADTDPNAVGNVSKLEIIARQMGLTLPEMYALATDNRQQMLDLVAELEREGVIGKVATLKTRSRSLEKIDADYAGTFGQLTDIVRGGFTLDSFTDSDVIFNELLSRFPAVYDKGWRATPMGYADRSMLIQFENGLVGELQFWAPGMFDAKDQGGHQFYDEWRVLDDQGVDPSDPRMRDLVRQSLEFYEREVWSKLDETWDFVKELVNANAVGGPGG